MLKKRFHGLLKRLNRMLKKPVHGLFQPRKRKTRFAACYKINRLAQLILPAHPCAGEGLNFSDLPKGPPKSNAASDRFRPKSKSSWPLQAFSAALSIASSGISTRHAQAAEKPRVSPN